MSGWIKVDKDLPDTIRFRRVVRAVMKSNALRGVTDVSECFVVTLVLGALIRLWIYADTHISDDDTLDITLDEINDLVGVEGFAQALPADWLKVIDPDHVQLPDFLVHNGSSEKHRRDNARRQADYRHRHIQHNVTRDVTKSNASNDARPDQIRPDQKREEKNTDRASAKPERVAEPEGFADFRKAYPKRQGSQRWQDAMSAYRARLHEGSTPAEILAGAERYALCVRAEGKEGTEYVQQAATFIGKNRGYTEPWKPPAKVVQLGPVERVLAAARKANGDERVVSEQFGEGDGGVGHAVGNLRQPVSPGVRRIASNTVGERDWDAEGFRDYERVAAPE